MDVTRDNECWTGCGRPGFWAHDLADRGGHVVLCELHHLEHSVSRSGADALAMLAEAWEAEGDTAEARRFRFYAEHAR